MQDNSERHKWSAAQAPRPPLFTCGALAFPRMRRGTTAHSPLAKLQHRSRLRENQRCDMTAWIPLRHPASHAGRRLPLPHPPHSALAKLRWHGIGVPPWLAARGSPAPPGPASPAAGLRDGLAHTEPRYRQIPRPSILSAAGAHHAPQGGPSTSETMHSRTQPPPPLLWAPASARSLPLLGDAGVPQDQDATKARPEPWSDWRPAAELFDGATSELPIVRLDPGSRPRGTTTRRCAANAEARIARPGGHAWG